MERLPAIKTMALISPHDHYLAYGLRLVSSFLKERGVDTRMIFLPGSTAIWQILFRQDKSGPLPDAVHRQIEAIVSDCDAIGITMMTMDRERVLELLALLKPLGKPIVLGGVHPTAFPEDAITLADHVFIGEGFDSLVEWCQDPGRTDIANTWIKRGDTVHKNPARPAVANIDDLPFPDYGPQNHWLLYGGKLRAADESLLKRFSGGMYQMFATLGCPYSCNFCINDVYKSLKHGYDKFRKHSVDYIIREIKYGLKICPGITHINFPDDGFIGFTERELEAFAEAYKREIGLPFSVVGIIPGLTNERKIDILAAAGLKRIRAGIQSGSAETLRFYRRVSGLAKTVELQKASRKHANMVYPYYDIITDNVFVDQEQDTLASIRFLLSLEGRFTVFLYSLRMYPGTEMFAMAKEQQLAEKYYSMSYIKFEGNILNYILTVIQCTSIKAIPNFLLKIYEKYGNVPVPQFLFSLNNIIFAARCGLEHVFKGDVTGLPAPFVPLARLSYRLRS